MSIATKPSWQDNDALLTYRVGPVLCCGPTLPIITITPPPSLTHLPGTSTAEPGIFKHGKYIVSATDLRYRFGVRQENWKQPGQVIIAQHGEQTRGYYVDEIKDVIHFPETGWGQLPAYLPRGIFTRTLLLNEQIYLYTEFEKLSQLQGSGYLAEYISRLEEINQKEINKKIIKQSEETKQVENNKAKSNNNQTNSQPTETKNITSSANTDDTNQKIVPTVKKLGTTNSASATSRIQAVAPTKTNKSPESTYNVTSKNSTRPGTVNKDAKIKETEKTQIPSTDNIKLEKINKTFSNSEKNKTDTISAQNIKQSKPVSTSSSIENKTPLPRKKVASQERVIPNLPDLKKKTEQPNEQNIKSVPNESLAKIEKKVPNKYPDHTKPVEPNGNFVGLFIVFIILLLGASGGYYYISYSTTENNVTTQSVNEADTTTSTQTSTIVLKDSSLLIVDAKKPASSEINLTAPEPLISESKPGDTSAIQSTSSLNQNQTTESLNSKNANTEISNTKIPTNKTKVNEYHASIKQEHDTITIELDGPLPPAIKNLDNSVPASDSAQVLNNSANEVNTVKTDTLEVKHSESILPKPETTQQIVSNAEPSKEKLDDSPKTKSVEIVHIIVKGDTLWAIAKHYLLNPFRYPELAKLSKIRNPDLIYPGNRVRIIYKNNPNK